MDMMAIDLQAANKEKKGVPTLKACIATFKKEVACRRRIPAAAGTADATPSGVSRVRVIQTAHGSVI